MAKNYNEIKRSKGRIPLAKQMPDFKLGRGQRYKGNENLKAPQVGLPLQTEHVNELKKCAKDYKYFVRNYIHILNVDEGLIQFSPYPYQNDLMDLTVDNRFVIAKLPRQSGKCVFINTIIHVKNTLTNKTYKMTVGDFYERIKKEKDSKIQQEKILGKEKDGNGHEVQRQGTWSELRRMCLLWNESKADNKSFAQNASKSEHRKIQTKIPMDGGGLSSRNIDALGGGEESGIPTWRKILPVFRKIYQRDGQNKGNESQGGAVKNRQWFQHSVTRILVEKDKWRRRISKTTAIGKTNNIFFKEMYSKIWAGGRQLALAGTAGQMDEYIGFKAGRGKTENKKIQSSTNGIVSGKRDIKHINKGNFRNRISICYSEWKQGICLRFLSWYEHFRILWRLLARKSKNLWKQKKEVQSSGNDDRIYLAKRQRKNKLCNSTWLQHNDHMGIGLQTKSESNHSSSNKPSDTVERKFIENIEIPDYYQIETDTGWKPITTLYKTIPYQIYDLYTEDCEVLKCADEHIVFRNDYTEAFVKDLIPGDKIITRHGIKSVTSIVANDKKDNMYDIEVNDENHRYWSGDILSHNTTTVGAILLWFALFNTGFKTLLLSYKKDQAKDILARIKTAYENLPNWMQQGVETWSKEKIELENGSEIMADGTSPSSGRGGTFNLVYLDEFAFVPYNVQEQFFRSAYPTISSGKTTRVLITSTPNGMNMFYKIWHDSSKNINTYKNIDIHWSDVPGRDEIWKEEQLKNMTQRQFEIEYECKFLGSIRTLIDSKKLEVMTNAIPIKHVPDGEQPGLKIFEEPKAGHKYICTVDTSRGIGEDYSAFIITDITKLPYVNVATFRHSEIHPVMYPTVIVPELIKYNNAFVLIELNDIGSQVADIIHDEYEYPNILTTLRKQGKAPQLSMEYSTKHELGVKTSEAVKRKGCAQLKVLIETDRIVHNDIEIFQEMSTFISKKRSFEAEEGKFDDFIACQLLFSWATDETFFKEMTNLDVRRDILSVKQDSYEEMPDVLTGYDVMNELDWRKDGLVATKNFDRMLLEDVDDIPIDEYDENFYMGF